VRRLEPDAANTPADSAVNKLSRAEGETDLLSATTKPAQVDGRARAPSERGFEDDQSALHVEHPGP